MHKELNPELFGERRNRTQENSGTSSVSGAGGVTSRTETTIGTHHFFTDPGILNVDRQISDLKKENIHLHEQINKLSGQMNESLKNASVKIERLQQQMTRMEQSHNGLALEAGQKISQLSSKVTERKAVDAKIQEMVDRHNNVIKSFEVRLNHLQKLLAEKDAQVVAAQAALNEAKMEIARLKRM